MKVTHRVAVVVLGMHRSGTSAVMRCLNRLGVEIGDRLLPPSTGNESGFWEHRDIFDTHERLLDELGSSWDDVRPLPESWWRLSEVAPYEQKLVEIVERDFDDSPLWGFKDPRTCRLLPLWKRILEKVGSSARFVIVVRNPEEVARSLAKRDGFATGKSYLLWLQHAIDSERETRKLPRVFVAYEDLLDDWVAVAKKIERTLGIRWPASPEAAAAEIEDFLRPELRHHNVDDRAFETDPNLSAWLRKAYSGVRRATAGGGGAMNRTLDSIRKELLDVETLYVPVISELARENRELADDAQREKSAWEARSKELSQVLEQTRAQLDEARSELAGSREDLASTRERLETTEKDLARSRQAFSAARDDSLARQRELATARRDVEGARGALDEARKELHETRHALSAARSRLDDHARRVEALSAELDATRRRVAAAEVRRSDARRLAARAFRWLVPNRLLRSVERRLALRAIRKSRLFDSDYYRKRAPVVNAESASETELIEHYLREGAHLRLDPNPLFDTSYYLEHNPDVAAAGVNPLAHYIRRGAGEGRDPGPLFDTSYYLGSNRDVAQSGVNPLAHFIHNGMAEGRNGLSSEALVKLLEAQTVDPTASACRDYFATGNGVDTIARPKIEVGVYSSQSGENRFRDIRDLITAGLAECGVRATAFDDTTSRPERLTHDIIVAPHEFFYLGHGPEWTSHPMVDQAIVVNTERLQTPGFSNGLPFLLRARVVVDINFHVAAALRHVGLGAHFLPLGVLKGSSPFDGDAALPDLAGLKWLPPSVRAFERHREEALHDRPIDVVFVGRSSPRRETFFAENAGFFRRYHCFLHLSRPSDNGVRSVAPELSGETVAALSQRSKIQLNVHRHDIDYFEWRRMVLFGIWQKTLVVSERCFEVPGLRPGEHYCAVGRDEIPGAIEWFLDSDDGRREAEEMRVRAYDAVAQSYDFKRVMGGFVANVLKER